MASKLVRHGLMGAAASVALLAAVQPAMANGTSTAQSVQVSITTGTAYVVTGSITYGYQNAVAAGYFTNQLKSGPTVSCSGSPTNCAAGNQPLTAPNPPAPDVARLTPVVSANSCTFFNGGTLNVQGGQATYTQSVTVSGRNGNGNWRYTWTYEITTTATVAQKTAWEIVASNTQAVPVEVSGFLAGQSTAVKSSGPWTVKASHSLTDSTGAARLQNAQATLLKVLDDDSTASVGAVPLAYTVEKNRNWLYSISLKDPMAENPELAIYGSNASQVFNNATVDDIQNGIATTLDGRKDNFAGNNGTGGERAVFTDLHVADLTEPGNYKLMVSGTLKGNDGGAAASFGVGSSITVHAGTCTDSAS